MKYDPALLPPGLARLLGLGCTGRAHLARLADAALAQAGAASSAEQGALLLELGMDFLLAAWEADPLDGRLAAMLLSLAGKLPILPRPALETLRAAAGNWREPENTAYLDRLADAGDPDRLARYLADRIRREPDNLAWAQRLSRLGLEAGDPALVRTALAGLKAPALRNAALPLLADAALAATPGKALRPASEAAAGLPLPDGLSRLARAMLAGGDRDKARETLLRSLEARPWRSSDRLLLRSIEHNADRAAPPPPGRLRVLLAGSDPAALDATLAALAPELPGDARVAALALGDPEAAVLLRLWGERLGGRLDLEELPLDPGRPAARNWLLARDGSRDADWLLFADPGAVPAPGWAGRLGAALPAHPDAAAIGCRILAAGNPGRVLAADGGLLFGLEGELGEHAAPGGGKVPFMPADLHTDLPDLGRFSYTRPCLFASGAFLLVRTAALAEERFDLRFSPHGHDDTDLGLRLALAGLRTTYAGQLAVAAPAGDAPGVEAANLYKLQMKHSPPDAARLAEIQAGLHAGA
ncbi:MAG: hypothetical protein AB1916_10325 [Thermodesulfobacteriota bacterium]